MIDPLKNIENSKKAVYFVSPHLDDAVLSAGGLLKLLSKKKKVTLITVFTQAGEKPYTFSTKRNLTLNGVKDAKKLYEIRRAEDIALCKKLKIAYIHLPYQEALYRKKPHISRINRVLSVFLPEFVAVYPFYKKILGTGVISGKIAKEDKKLLAFLKKDLKRIIPSQATVFCPKAEGDHVDHVIVRKACEETFKDLYFWVDFPYTEQVKQSETIAFETPKDLSLLNFYKSQIKNIPIKKKKYFDLFLKA